MPSRASKVAIAPGQKLEALLDAAMSLSRDAVAEVMAFCLDNSSAARSHANQLVSRLLERPVGPLESRDVASLYCLSDVLYNASHTPGAVVYRHAFQDSLPGIAQRLYRALTIERSCSSGQSGSRLPLAAEAAVRQLFSVWRDWEVFPELFLQGLEAATFGGALADTQALADAAAGPRAFLEAHDVLRHEERAVESAMEAYAVLDTASLERQCKNRGLVLDGGREEFYTRAALLGRLRLFEEYWLPRTVKNGQSPRNDGKTMVGTSTQPSASSAHEAPSIEEDVDGEPVDMPTLLRHKARAKIGAVVAEDPCASAVRVPSTAPGTSSTSSSWLEASPEDDLDGEPIGVLELQRWRAAAAVGAAGGAIISSSSTASAEDFDGDAIDALLTISQQAAELIPGGRPKASGPAQAPVHSLRDLIAQRAAVGAVEDEKSLRRRARHKQHELSARKEQRARRRDRSRGRRRRKLEAPAAATAAASAAAAAANAAAFLSARSRAPAAPVLAPSKVASISLGVVAGGNAVSTTSRGNGSRVAPAREPTPEPDGELDGEPLDSSDEQHLMLQEKLAEKKRQFLGLLQ